MVNRTSEMRNKNHIFLSGSNITLDKTQAAMKKIVSEMASDDFKSEMFSVII